MYFKWFVIAGLVLLCMAFTEMAKAFTPAVYQCPTIDPFIVYYIKSGQIYSIAGASNNGYLACQEGNCKEELSMMAEAVIFQEANANDNVMMVDLNQVCK